MKNLSRIIIIIGIILILIAIFLYFRNVELKIEKDQELLIRVQYQIDENFKRCYTIHSDVLDIFDSNDYESVWDVQSNIDDYFKIKSVKEFIDVELKDNQKNIDSLIYIDIKNMNYNEVNVFEGFKELNFLHKEYCLSVLNYRLKSRDKYMEDSYDYENKYYDAINDTEEIIYEINY